MNKIWRLIFIVIGLAGSALACDAARPVVAVSFDLAVPRWQGKFGTQQDDFQNKAAQTIANWLGQQMGFAEFKAGAAGPHRLIVHLEVAPDAGTRQNKETQLRMELVGLAAVAPLVWRFRPDERYGEPTGGVDGFVRELELRLLDIDKQVLVRQLLSRVPIAHEAQLWKDPVGWVIPYRKAELCMDFRSMLRIENMLPSGAGPVLKEFMARASGDFAPRDPASASALMRGRLFTEPVPLQEGLADLGNAKPELVSIRAVYVVEYQPLQPCSKPVAPDAVDFSGASR